MMLKTGDSIEKLNGVGKTRAQSLHKIGIDTIGDLLNYYPRAYQNRGEIHSITSAAMCVKAGEYVPPMSFMLTIATEPKVTMIKGRMTIIKFKAFDETGTIEITYFNQAYLKDTFHAGEDYRFWGRPHINNGRLELTNPVHEYADGKTKLLPIVPVYKLTHGITQKFISALVKEALQTCEIEEFVPSETLYENNLCQIGWATRCIHFPEDLESIQTAVRRFSFNEVFLTACAMETSRTRATTGAVPMKNNDISKLENVFEYTLTGAQKRAIQEISNDLSTEKPMCRILCGDVGSGKTIVAAAAAYIAINNGSRCVLMAPTEILAKQHYADLSTLFDKLHISSALLCGSMSAKEKRELKEALSSENGPMIVIGTHALLSEDVNLEKFGLIITDEQHRFGVNQRALLREKTENAHSLVMSATPIPRTLSLVVYGELDVSMLDELPPGRQKVSTFSVDESYRDRLEGFIKKQSDEGHAVYIVCPSIEENPLENEENAEELCDITPLDFLQEDKLPLKAAVKYAEELQKKLPETGIGFVHGKLKPTEKDKVMNDFIAGNINVLVSTTVIEVGVNVPRATLMIVENAERFGLSQLHQLRGRVGRGKDKSWCILVSDTKNDTSKQRLKIMCDTSDGFKIAEEDLKMRGPGDFLRRDGDVRQHGNSDMPFASSCQDTEMIIKAAEAAKSLLAYDPELISERNEVLKRIIDEMQKGIENTIN